MSGVYWIRRDLRTHDNPALSAAVAQGVNTAVFISTPLQWQQHNLAPIKADFIARHLLLLSQQLAVMGIELVHLHAKAFDDQNTVLTKFCQQRGYSQIYANSEPELDEINRDERLGQSGLSLNIFHCDTIIPPGNVLNKQGEMFKVFTPFKNAWLQRLRQTGVAYQALPDIEPARTIETASQCVTFNYPLVDSTAWPLADVVMAQVFPRFIQTKLERYGAQRDIPSIKGTSGLSPYLAIGAISPRWLALQLIQQVPEILEDQQHLAFSWLNELIWRDFYKHLLFHYPSLIKGDSFQPKYQGAKWIGSEQDFNAWCQAKTGYPLVDAAMRQLLQTGWMHNRLRMVVASFLTKHLLVDWRLGEQFFMSHLIDGDFSANNGGWQWAASTGCDAQPYFRIFNPITQSQKFDPNGKFIRKYVPELANIPDKHIHFPHEYIAQQGIDVGYCLPIVEHKQARLRALAFYKAY
ncbi:deoxyribodipyrimidine photo-lyase [Shewanella colwelliana]|uniref:deoxyribodipyrimidine photo-lyase n=1 Tax=Shewanella colwelliana TaxID=23 RepID=UPI0037368403